jgi:hypothetical protein
MLEVGTGSSTPKAGGNPYHYEGMDFPRVTKEKRPKTDPGKKRNDRKRWKRREEIQKGEKDHEFPKEPTLTGNLSSPERENHQGGKSWGHAHVTSPGLPLLGYCATGIYISACGPFGVV